MVNVIPYQYEADKMETR